MGDRDLRIRVGAAIDGSFNQVFATVTNTVKRARKQIEREMVSGAQVIGKEYQATEKKIDKTWENVAKAAKKAADTEAKEAKKAGDAAVREAKRKETADKKASAVQGREAKKAADTQAREAKRSADIVIREENRKEQNYKRMVRGLIAEQKRLHREEEKAAKGGGGGRIGKRPFSDRIVTSLATRATAALISAPVRLAGDMARGMGIDTSLSGQMTASVARQKLASEVASNAYISSGQGPAGSQTRQSTKSVEQSAYVAGTAVGIDSMEILEGMSKFVGMTGDLKTIQESLVDIGKIARANGADFVDMAQAAGEISNQMGDIPEKGKALSQVLRVVAGQGQMTAIELKDQARYIGMITGQANFYKADPESIKQLEKVGVTNETGQRIAIVSALAQNARARGGRVTARMAMQSSMAFMADLNNPNEVKRMKKAGIDTYANEGRTLVRDPLQILLKMAEHSMSKGGLDMNKMAKLVPNIRARAVSSAFALDYADAYQASMEKDEKKRHADAAERVTQEFYKMLTVTQSLTEVEGKFEEAMKTAHSQGVAYNNQLGKMTDALRDDLLPVIGPFTVGMIQATAAIAGFIGGLWGKLFGGDDEVKDKKNVDAMQRAYLADQVLHGSIAAGQISEGKLDQTGQAIGDLDKVLLETRKELADLNKGEDGTLADNYAKNPELMKDLGPTAARYHELQERAKEMEKILERAKTNQAELLQRVSETTGVGVAGSTRAMRVIIEKDETKPAPGVIVPPSATFDPNSSQER